MTSGARARLGVAIVVAVAVFVAGGVRLTAQGRAELAASDAAWAKGDAAGAASHARAAARAYAPGAAHMERGYERLRDIAETSERKGETDAARFAWRAILAAARGSRPFSAPCGDICSDAEGSLTRLSAAVQASGRGATSARRAASFESLPRVEVAPRVGWGALAVVGAALLWIAGLRLSRAWGSDGRLSLVQVRAAASLGAAGLLAWLGGLLLA